MISTCCPDHDVIWCCSKFPKALVYSWIEALPGCDAVVACGKLFAYEEYEHVLHTPCQYPFKFDAALAYCAMVKPFAGHVLLECKRSLLLVIAMHQYRSSDATTRFLGDACPMYQGWSWRSTMLGIYTGRMHCMMIYNCHIPSYHRLVYLVHPKGDCKHTCTYWVHLLL